MSSKPSKYGHLTVAEIGAMGGKKIAERGSEYFQEIGARGGRATAAKHGPEYYRKIGALGGKKAQEAAKEVKPL